MYVLLIAQVFSVYLVSAVPHPFLASLILILNSFLVSLMALELVSSWLTLSLFLIFLGGMMVIFLYFTSMCNNEKLLTGPLFPKLGWGLPLLLLLSEAPSALARSLNSILFLYSEASSLLIAALVAYLLLILITVVKLAESFKGTLETTWF